MIIGCMGKGGSGKSTIATMLVKHLGKQGKVVLAVDADHNMDLTYNLTGTTEISSYIGQGLGDLLSVCGLRKEEKYPAVFELSHHPLFSFTAKKDAFSDKYVHEISENISLMVAGPHTNSILHGQYCSHSLATPLKVYLPLLNLKNDEFVIIDEKAGSDGAGAGISTGMDAVCIVVEPTRHGIKAANQIAELLDFYDTPYILVANKILNDQDKHFLAKNIKYTPIVYFDYSSDTRNLVETENTDKKIELLLKELKSCNQNNRIERTVTKFQRNKAYI